MSLHQVPVTEQWGGRFKVLFLCCEWKSILRSVSLNRGHPIISDTDRIFCSSAIIPATVNVQTWKNHYSYKKVVYLPDSRWLITVEAVSMATSSLAAKGKWEFHPISFKMAPAFSERGELDLLGWDFCCETPNSARANIFIPVSTLDFLIMCCNNGRHDSSPKSKAKQMGPSPLTLRSVSHKVCL